MSSLGTISGNIYVEIVFLILFFILGFGLYLLIKAGISRLPKAKEKPAGIIFSRMNLPVVYFLISFCLKIQPIRDVFFSNRKLEIFLDGALIFFLLVLIIRLIDALFLSFYARRRIPLPLPNVLHGLILAVLYIVILFIILKNILGINITPFLATSAILTMILGLAFQGVLSNILSGMSLHLVRSFNKGNWIGVSDLEGIVIDTNWRETRLIDRLSNIIILPNNIVASEKITNFSLPDRRTGIRFPIKVSYEAPPTMVFKALQEVAGDIPEILTYPSPEVHILSYDDIGVSYRLKFWITDFNRKYLIMAEVGRKIWYKFQRNNIEIPVSLKETVKEVLKEIDVPKFQAIDKEEQAKNYRDLVESQFLREQGGGKGEEFFISEDEIRGLAQRIKRQMYAPGEIIFRQGDSGDSCYVLAKGKIRGIIEYQEKDKKYTSEFYVNPGGIFGEMSLFTGMPRTATGIVEEESELLEIRAEDFASLLGRNPALVEVVADIVSQRNLKNKAFLEKIKELSKEDIERSVSKRSILERLKGLIGWKS